MKARIKKIMQMDEDVGKVAQATPVLICELSKTFIIRYILLNFQRFSLLPRILNIIFFLFNLITTNHVAKALELFMQSLIDHACQETRTRNAKRMSVSHL